MRDEIRERIEAVRRGEVPEGYRRTRAGIMPSEWDGTVKARDIFGNYTDKSHGGNCEVLSATQDRGIIPRNEVDIDIKFDEDNLSTYKKVDVGDFVISLRSFQGGIEYSEYEGIVSPAYTVLKAKREIDNGYYRAYFKTADFIKRLNGAVYGIRDGKQIGFEDFGDLRIHCPPLQEQRRIAEILDACDRVIGLKQDLIEQKRKQKLWTVNRVFDFNEQEQKGRSVTQVELGTLCSILGRIGYRGYRESDIVGEREGAITLSPSNIVDGKMKYSRATYISWHKYEESPEIKVQPGDIVFVKTGSSYGKSGLVDQLPWKATINPQLVIIRPNKVKPEYLVQIMQSKMFQEQVERVVIGGTIPTMTQEQLARFTIPLFEDKEQERIGNMLLKYDQEVEMYQMELYEWQKKKKALMQLLLTGLVRVNT